MTEESEELLSKGQLGGAPYVVVIQVRDRKFKSKILRTGLSARMLLSEDDHHAHHGTMILPIASKRAQHF